jgi:hypothetical protein
MKGTLILGAALTLLLVSCHRRSSRVIRIPRMLDPATEQSMREGVIAACRELSRREPSHGTSGNISIRRDARRFSHPMQRLLRSPAAGPVCCSQITASSRSGRSDYRRRADAASRRRAPIVRAKAADDGERWSWVSDFSIPRA